MKKLISNLFFVFFIFSLFGQNDQIIPVQINEKFSDFELVDHTGKFVKSKDLRGKKIMLVFIRGKATAKVWCSICQYQYLELAEYDNKHDMRKKNNMEIYFIMPYKKDSLENWIKAFPKSIKTVEGWKNPGNENITDGQAAWRDYCKIFFPNDYSDVAKNVKLSIPVLFDENQKVSNGLFLYKEEWGGTKVGQNIPTIFIIDEEGFVKFKYHSQYTNDRPDADYLNKYLNNMF